jgi:hypothetical protein
MTQTKSRFESGRFGVDQRFRSQLAYLRSAASVSIGGPIPSDSHLVRRALGLLTDWYQNMIEAGRADGLPGPHSQDVLAEREALTEYANVVDAQPPRSMIDHRGRLRSWQEAISDGINSRRGLSIPSPNKARARKRAA